MSGALSHTAISAAIEKGAIDDPATGIKGVISVVG